MTYRYTFIFGDRQATLDRAVELQQRSFFYAVRQQANRLGLTAADLTSWEVRCEPA